MHINQGAATTFADASQLGAIVYDSWVIRWVLHLQFGLELPKPSLQGLSLSGPVVPVFFDAVEFLLQRDTSSGIASLQGVSN